MPTTVEVLVEAFRDWGTPFIVGHPGGESVEMIQAARERGMRFILMKQETAGAMLAATWGEITGVAWRLSFDSWPRRRQYGQRRGARMDGPLPADRYHRPIRPQYL